MEFFIIIIWFAHLILKPFSDNPLPSPSQAKLVFSRFGSDLFVQTGLSIFAVIFLVSAFYKSEVVWTLLLNPVPYTRKRCVFNIILLMKRFIL